LTTTATSTATHKTNKHPTNQNRNKNNNNNTTKALNEPRSDHPTIIQFSSRNEEEGERMETQK
jgi:hypothetical protein